MTSQRSCGHPPTPENTLYVVKDGRKVANGCRPCAFERRRLWALQRRREADIPSRPRPAVEDPDLKRCATCGQVKPLAEFHTRKDRDGGYSRGRQAKCKQCVSLAAVERRKLIPEKTQDWNRSANMRLRREALAAYADGDTPHCRCCGESEEVFLALDHIDNDGGDHRRSLAKAGRSWSTYRDLRRRGWPPGMQILCANCNWAKYRLGTCPHRSQHRDGAIPTVGE